MPPDTASLPSKTTGVFPVPHKVTDYPGAAWVVGSVQVPWGISEGRSCSAGRGGEGREGSKGGERPISATDVLHALWRPRLRGVLLCQAGRSPSGSAGSITGAVPANDGNPH